MVQLELVSGAGMTQRVENNIRQFGFGFELGEGLIDSLFLAGIQKNIKQIFDIVLLIQCFCKQRINLKNGRYFLAP